MEILVVASDESVINSLKAILRLGHRVFVSKNGENGLKSLKKRKFGLLMVDVESDEIAGVNMLVALRKKERNSGKHIPVIALGSLPESRLPGMEVGFNDVLRKPISHPEILELLDKLIPSLSDKSPVDKEAGLALCGGDEKQYADTLQIFSLDGMLHVKRLEDALRRDDTPLIRQHAHALKNAAGSICAEVFQKIAMKIEDAAKKNDLSNADILFGKLLKEYDRVKKFLRSSR